VNLSAAGTDGVSACHASLNICPWCVPCLLWLYFLLTSVWLLFKCYKKFQCFGVSVWLRAVWFSSVMTVTRLLLIKCFYCWFQFACSEETAQIWASNIG